MNSKDYTQMDRSGFFGEESHCEIWDDELDDEKLDCPGHDEKNRSVSDWMLSNDDVSNTASDDLIYENDFDF